MKKLILMVFIFAFSMLCISGCGNEYTAQDLRDAKERYFNGNASREDEIMVEGFYEWKAKQ